jgi:hypothetical protein
VNWLRSDDGRKESGEKWSQFALKGYNHDQDLKGVAPCVVYYARTKLTSEDEATARGQHIDKWRLRMGIVDILFGKSPKKPVLVPMASSMLNAS